MIVGGVEDLKNAVLSKNLCVGCGACVNLCPYIDMVEGKAMVFESCGLKKGKCFAFCPRTYLDVAFLDYRIFNTYRTDHVLGVRKMITTGRAKNPEIRAVSQYGGVVSALMSYALEIGEIDSAVLVKSENGIDSQPLIARKRDEVLACARSKYLVCPTISILVEAIKHERGSIGFVGTPCQVEAVRKMQTSELKLEASKIKFIIGLFCTWALHPSAREFIKERVKGRKILKLDVPPPPANTFIIQTEDGRLEVPLDDLRRFILPSCNACFDMTNEFADISVGTVEGEEGWNMIIIRTNVGERILQKAVENNVLELKPSKEDNLKHLYEAVLTRKRRVISEASPGNIAYLLLNDEYKLKILKEAEAS